MHDRKLIRAFLDSSALIKYIRGEGASANLFQEAIRERVRYAINPIVLQELLAIAEVQRHPNFVSELERRVKILPLDIVRVEPLLRRAGELRNRIVHSNDLLILASAESCDFLVTYDRDLLEFAEADLGPRVVTTEQFLASIKGDPQA